MVRALGGVYYCSIVLVNTERSFRLFYHSRISPCSPILLFIQIPTKHSWIILIVIILLIIVLFSTGILP